MTICLCEYPVREIIAISFESKRSYAGHLDCGHTMTGVWVAEEDCPHRVGGTFTCVQCPPVKLGFCHDEEHGWAKGARR